MPYPKKSSKSAKPTKPTVLATAPRPSRIVKGKARMMIRTATVSRPRVPRVPANPRRNLPMVSRPDVNQTEESASGGKSSDIEDSLNDRGTLMEDIQRMIQGSLSKALAVRDGKDNDKNLATNLPTTPIAAGHLAGAGTIPLPPPSLASPLAISQHVLSHWHWVSEDMIKSIATGHFEIDNLPKLHRSDELRNAYLK